jgi:plastocyanin
MRRTGIFVALLASVGLLVTSVAAVQSGGNDDGSEGNGTVVLRDDCDPTDLGWAPTGGCTRTDGSVTLAEFGAQRLQLPFSPSVVGHPAWWFDPNYLKLRAGKTLNVVNEGGRVHTFTEVAVFGGGRVPPLNAAPAPLLPVPECAPALTVDLPGGAKTEIENLAPGNHKFQCCIHPWMRTLVKVHQ